MPFDHHIAPQALLPHTATCAACGQTSDRFDPLILDEDNVAVCAGCVPAYIERKVGDYVDGRRSGVLLLDASNINAFWDALCAGDRPKRKGPVYDWTVSKEENQRRAMAEIDAAFAPKRGVVEAWDGLEPCASYGVSARDHAPSTCAATRGPTRAAKAGA